MYICMEGGVNYWFRFWRKKVKNPTRATLTEAMVKRFGGRHRGTIFEKLAAVLQKGSVEEYVQELEIPVAHATGVTKEQLLGYFFCRAPSRIEGSSSALRSTQPINCDGKGSGRGAIGIGRKGDRRWCGE